MSAIIQIKNNERLGWIYSKIDSASVFENSDRERIKQRYFPYIPRHVRYLTDKLGFHEKKVLDIGSWYGNTALYWGDQSESVEVQDIAVQFLKFCGRKVWSFNVEDGFPEDLLRKDRFEAVYSNNLIEHLVAPHFFLASIWNVLKPGGILALGHPVLPAKYTRPIWKRLAGSEGYLAKDHINFYTPEVIRLSLERAGFRVLKQVGTVINADVHVPASLSPSCLSICRKDETFRYPKIRYSEFDPEFAKKTLQSWRV